MSDPHIHNRYRTIPASKMLTTLGESLERIKAQDGATDGDLGAVLGKSDDTAARYRTGLAEMPVVAFLRGCREWDGRFANDVLALVGMRLAPIDGSAACDGRSAIKVLGALIGKKAEALEDGVITDDEVDDMWPEIEAVSAHIDRLRSERAQRMRRIGQS
ncbi:MAG: hypothetical protein PGN16_03890 [Sphingomonas phyllosphaerae]|uniref:hypothetical protein n=1 Tax=Sphingomonas phyllosphaerae TaxID=257003 RepID=UPI002FF50900